MKDCRKRQVERRGDETLHRCVHKQADAYRQPVDASVCDSCPMRVFVEQRRKKGKLPGLPVIDTSGFPSCEFRSRSGSEAKCSVTNLTVSKEQCNGCAAESKTATAKILGKAVNYAKALRRWVAAGRPERTDAEIEQLFDDHCSKCSMFQNGVCNSCGCPASKDQPAIRNKLRMATEKCPLGQFPAKV
jgi:hypothetical protein